MQAGLNVRSLGNAPGTVAAADDGLADFSTDSRVLLLSFMAMVIGAISSFVAYALLWLIAAITNLAFYHRFSAGAAIPQAHHLGLWVVLVPVAGALVVGLMARFGSERIRGHGIPEALEAILLGRSRIQPRVALLKPLSAAISIGTGGPFGAEGPIIMTGGAVGSMFAQQFHLSAAERKTLLVAGAAAGMSAVFATPVAAVLLAVELLLFEWKPRSFIPVAVASIVASVLRVPLLGAGPIFPVPVHAPVSGKVLMSAAGLGMLAGFGSGVLTMLVYVCEDVFQRLPIHWMWWPAIGAVFVGVGGWLEPRVLGVGYDTIHSLLRGELLGAVVLGLLVAKAVVWSIALGSGTSGGVLAPLLIIGGAFGAFAAGWLPAGDPGLWALVGMAAMMGGTMRSPLTAMAFAVELTRDYNLVPALLISTVAALGVNVLFMRRSILTEKLARRGYHITREYSIDPFELLRVRDVMDNDVQAVPANMKVSELSDRISRGDPKVSRRQGTLVLNEQNQLVGIITRGDMVRALRQPDAAEINVAEAGSTDLVVAFPNEPLHAALAKMLDRDVGRLPVVERDSPGRPVGYVGRAEILSARKRLHEEENLRQRG
ncbi:MAG TPA: chloride channel protein [Candidatus Acidoferrum sp.]|nr:chloride channel protein [Candidatus Acidoferrum sp.]